ncbi:hypothetical protein GALMADRAFT_265230 [Galerina marginata CBS 339.88]|uniref:Uncharacterized protein n=1 Tax=Galerina marginata (strain CBS 339.88) TaxID=685588 RepID=A0A067TA81_GALM3|nr:hypothetical protein GALMADRAFT_265230 [Galerina marginata CBS 339.88]
MALERGEKKARGFFADAPSAPESYALLSLPTLNKEDPSPVKSRPWPGGYFPPRPAGKQRRFNPQTFIPMLVIVGQLAVLVFGWIFFFVTSSKPRPLPAHQAEFARDHAQDVTLAVITAATLLSVISSFLYTRAIRYALARILSEPVTLYTVTSALKVATQSPIFNVAHLEWTIGALVCALAVGGQTAGWMTLLAPTVINIEAPMSGFELDVHSPDFQTLMITNRDLVTPDLFTNVIPLVEASGSTAVSTHFSLPSILNFNQLSYLNSTNGILPANFQPWFSTVMSPSGNTMPANTRVELPHGSPPGFPTSYSMTQQGFTSDVTCTQRHLDETTSPSLEVVSQTRGIFHNSTTVTFAQLKVQCPGSPTPILSAPIMTSPDVHAVFSLACPVNQTDGTQKWELIISGCGVYSFMNTTVCTVSPKVNSINIDYNDATQLFNSSFPRFVNGSESWGAVDAPWVGEYTTSIFLRGLDIAQSPTGNNIGDMISSFVATVPAYPNLLNDVLQHYIRGVMEFSVTLLRTAYTQNDNRLFPGNSSTIPTSMRIATHGTYRTQTIGWYQTHDTALIVLFAPTFVCLVSIAVVIITFVRSKGRTQPASIDHFDPGNILHVIAASSAGGMWQSLPSFDENPVEYSQKVKIKLGPVDGDPRRVGFVHVEKGGY